MKAILVIDMPSNCKDCNKLVRKGCLKGDYRKDERPSTCPLRPLPKKKSISLKEAIGIKCSCYSDGWNDCIDEILGGEKMIDIPALIFTIFIVTLLIYLLTEDKR